MSINKILKPEIHGDINRLFDDAEKQKLSRTVREFESIFVGYMLKSMRNTIPESGLFGDNFGGDVLEGMFDMEFARHLSGRRGVGIGAILYKQLTGEELPVKDDRPPRIIPVNQNIKRTSVGYNIEHTNTRIGISLITKRIEEFENIIDKAATRYEVDPNLIKAVIAAESAGKQNARSLKDAKGLMQLMDGTAQEMGVVNVWDPGDNIMGGTKYLKSMLNKFNGDITLALASYNAGPGTVERFKGIPPYPETQNYIQRVLNFKDLFSK